MTSLGCLGSPYGRVQVEVGPHTLRLVPRTGLLEPVQWFRLVGLVGVLVLAGAGGSSHGTSRTVLLVAAGVLLAAIVLTILAEVVALAVGVGYLVVSLLTRSGRARLGSEASRASRRRRRREVVVPRESVRTVSRDGSRLVVTHAHEQLTLTARPWERRRLEALEQALR